MASSSTSHAENMVTSPTDRTITPLYLVKTSEEAKNASHPEVITPAQSSRIAGTKVYMNAPRSRVAARSTWPDMNKRKSMIQTLLHSCLATLENNTQSSTRVTYVERTPSSSKEKSTLSPPDTLTGLTLVTTRTNKQNT